MARLTVSSVLMLGLTLTWIDAAAGDEVLFLNGDRLSGKVVSAADGKLKIKTEGAGEVTIDLAKVKTFSTDAAVRVGVGDAPPVASSVRAGTDRQVQTGEPPHPLAIADIKTINVPPPAWTGSIAVDGLLTTGNSETAQFGARASLSKRWPSDRLNFAAEYSFGRQRDPDTRDTSTTVDYAMGLGKYDHFFTKKLYGYLGTKAERDGVAELELRLTPGTGLGYQWFERPTFNLSTEAGLVWVYENYKRTGTREFFGPRFAYAVDWTPVQPLTLYHKLEYIPSFEDLRGDYLLNIDAGARVALWKGFFAELRYEFRYDSTPAPGRDRSDARYIFGGGWSF